MTRTLTLSAALLTAALIPLSLASAAPERTVTSVFASGTEGYEIWAKDILKNATEL